MIKRGILNRKISHFSRSCCRWYLLTIQSLIFQLYVAKETALLLEILPESLWLALDFSQQTCEVWSCHQCLYVQLITVWSHHLLEITPVLHHSSCHLQWTMFPGEWSRVLLIGWAGVQRPEGLQSSLSLCLCYTQASEFFIKYHHALFI